MLAQRTETRKKLSIIFPSEDYHPDCNEPIIGKWTQGADGTLLRRCFLPDGMTIEEAEQIVSQPGWRPSVFPAERQVSALPLEPEW